jgi:hypothetical protein
MRERSMAAAGDPALVRRMSKAIQKVLDLLITNLTSKSKAYKSKVTPAILRLSNSKEYPSETSLHRARVLEFSRFPSTTAVILHKGFPSGKLAWHKVSLRELP